MKIDVTKNTSVKLGNIGQVRQAYAGDFSAMPKAIGQLSGAIGDIGRVVGRISVDLKEREDNAKINEAMSKLIIGSGRITDGILGDDALSPSDYQDKYQEGYDRLYGEVTKDLDSRQLEKMKMASSRIHTSAMVSLGHTAMERTVAREKASAVALCAAAKARAIESPNAETIGFYLGAFTDAEKATTQQIEALEAEGRTQEAAALREALRIRQVQGIDEIKGIAAENQIRLAEDSLDVATLETLAKKDWRKDEEPEAAYNRAIGRTGFGDKAAHALKSEAEMALKRVKSRKHQVAKDAVLEKEVEMYSKPMPTDAATLSATLTGHSRFYLEASKNEDLTLEERKSLVQTAQALKDESEKVLTKAGAADMELRRKEGERLFKLAKTSFEAGVDPRSREPYTREKMANTARRLLASGKITSEQYAELMKIHEKHLDPVSASFRDKVFDAMPFLRGKISAKDGFIVVGEKVDPNKKTEYKFDSGVPFLEELEETTYADLVRAMNLTIEKGTAENWTVDQMWEDYKKNTRYTQSGANKSAISLYLDKLETAFEDREKVRNAVGQ